MTTDRDDRLECWDPAREATRDEPPRGPRATACEGTGRCPEAQADGVPCPDPKRLCEVCGRAH